MCNDENKAYVKLKKIPEKLGLNKGDTLLVSSDLKGLLFQCLEHGDAADPNVFLESLMDAVGSEGTLLLPTFNWDFCKGITFDYRRTPCRTGSLGKAALKRKDFVRTKHPPLPLFRIVGKGKAVLITYIDKKILRPGFLQVGKGRVLSERIFILHFIESSGILPPHGKRVNRMLCSDKIFPL